MIVKHKFCFTWKIRNQHTTRIFRAANTAGTGFALLTHVSLLPLWVRPIISMWERHWEILCCFDCSLLRFFSMFYTTQQNLIVVGVVVVVVFFVAITKSLHRFLLFLLLPPTLLQYQLYYAFHLSLARVIYSYNNNKRVCRWFSYWMKAKQHML